MHTDPDKHGQRRSFRTMSGAAVVVCLLIAALMERRRRARPAPSIDWSPSAAAPEPVWEDAPSASDDAWPAEQAAPSEPVDAVWEAFEAPSEVSVDVDDVTLDTAATPVELPELEHEAEVEVQYEPIAAAEPEADVEAERAPAHSSFDLPPLDPHESLSVVEAEQPLDSELSAETEPGASEPEAAVAAPSHWFGSFAPATPWAPKPETGDERVPDADTDAFPAVSEAVTGQDDAVVVLPPESDPAAGDETPAAPGPRPLPPARLRRFMGTGLSVLVLSLVLVSGVLVSGATADSTSDPTTVPDAVGTLADPGAPVADSVPGDTTTTATTAADTTTTDTTTTGTTTTDTTTTSTTSTDPTTTTTTTGPTTTTTTDPTTTTPPTDPTTPTDTTTVPVAPPADPVVPAAPAVTPPPLVTPPPAPIVPATPPTHKVTPKHKAAPPKPRTPSKPAKAAHSPVTGDVAASTTGPAVVTLASGADPIGSILARTSAIPALDASLLPTPAQVRFYVKAAQPLPRLPKLVRVDHAVAQRLVVVGQRADVSWTVLAAVSRLESNLGAKPGPLAGHRLKTAPTGDGVRALATFLHVHGATRNPLEPAASRKALKAYLGTARKADRAIALAALYGALGPYGMQHGVRAETARLQRRVLRDKRVHLTKSGRGDVKHGRVDPRVLVTLEYLANSFRTLGVSDLVSGGQVFSRSGAVSAHLYGRAADVASLRGVKVRGHQGPGTLTEQAIHRLLLLPKFLRPRQIISLMDVDGPTGNRGSFALPDHYNRIQIDY